MPSARRAPTPPPAKAQRKPRPETPAPTPAPPPGGGVKAGDSLFPTGVPGVYVNRAGTYVDERGVLRTWAEVRKLESEADVEIIGEPANTPAKFLKRIALDTRLPLHTRLDAANKAAPYFDRKQPLSVEAQGGLLAGGLDLTALTAMPRDKRQELLALLKQIGIKLE